MTIHFADAAGVKIESDRVQALHCRTRRGVLEKGDKEPPNQIRANFPLLSPHLTFNWAGPLILETENPTSNKYKGH